MEKSALIVGAVLIYYGSKKWMSKYLEISQTDELTQLPNRSHTKELMNQEIESKKPFCLVIIDIDYFKNINDTYGHYYGDVILSVFSGLLGKNMRPNDIFGRWGGEEFVVIMKDIKKIKAHNVISNFRSIIERRSFKIANKNIKLTASFGIAQYDYFQHDFKKLFIEADRALYKAKNAGRNKVM